MVSEAVAPPAATPEPRYVETRISEEHGAPVCHRQGKTARRDLRRVTDSPTMMHAQRFPRQVLNRRVLW